MKYDKFIGLILFIICLFISNSFAEIKPSEIDNHTVQEKFLLLDVEKLDKVMGMTKIENGLELTYRLRRLDELVNHVTKHTNHDHHGHSEDYALWREYLRQPHPTVETFEYFFAEAAQEFGVPVEILKAIGHVESNWTQIGPSIDRGWGVMHLVQNNYANTLGKAAALLRIKPQVLQNNPRQNIRGAAALIAYYAREQRHTFTQLEDWFEAVKQVTGLINETLREMQAVRYYEVIKTGAESQTLWGETIVLASHPNISLTPDKMNRIRTRRNLRSTDYQPAVANLTSCNYSPSSDRSVDTWVNHWIGQGTYAGAISWFHNCNAKASAHFVIRASDGQISQLVPIKDIAWHAGVWSYNRRSIGVEHEVTITNSSGWNTTWTTSMLKASAKMARHFADKYNIPNTRSTTPGILGHNEIKSTTCPGTLPWDDWMNYFKGGSDLKLDASIKIEPNPIVQGSPVTVTVKIVNHGVDAFKGNIAAALHTTSGDFLADIGRQDNETINSDEEVKIYTFHQSTLTSKPGDYQLQIKYFDGSGWNIIPADTSNPLTVKIIEGTTIQPDDPNEYQWQGNGSLISYHGRLLSENAGEDWPYGITQDVVQLHPSTKKPVVFFQWQINEENCQRLKLDMENLPSSENKVDVTIGTWDDRESDITFYNVNLPFVLAESNTGNTSTSGTFQMNNGNWYVVKVALHNKLTQKAKLHATCTLNIPSTSSYKPGSGDSAIIDDGYKWNGNGSIISHLFAGTSDMGGDWPHGAFKDMLQVRRSPEKPIIFFQWQHDSICSTLTIDAPTLNTSQKRVNIHTKPWDDDNNHAITFLDKTLPYTLEDRGAEDGSWSVIQIKFLKPVDYTANVTAKCPGID